MKDLLKTSRKLLKDKRIKKFWYRGVSGIATLIIFVTTYALVLPAITLEKTAYCGIEEHQHSEDCYSKQLVCGMEERDGHQHDDHCYSVTRELSCQLEEHQHSQANGCYDENGNLICDAAVHTHDDSCYEEVRNLICGMEESDGHHHSDTCYEKVLVCGKDAHIHSENCYLEAGSYGESAETAESEDSSDADTEYPEYTYEETSGAAEDLAFKSGTLTAEGDDYTITLDYTEQARIPENAELSVREITAKTDREAYEECLAQAEQQVRGSDEEKTNIDAAASRFFDIEILVIEDTDGIEGQARKIEPAAPVSVNIRIADETKPAGAETEAGAIPQSDPTVLHFAEEGVEKIDSTVKDSRTVDNVKGAETEVLFEAESFSVYGLVYTVDFHWEANGKTYDFSIPGGGFISFRSLIETLEIETDDKNTEKDEVQDLLDGVEKIDFSAPELVSVSKAEEDTTVGAVKDGLALECEYSAELTAEQIEKINEQEVKAGDWALISLKPFDTEESLTVTMKNGDQWVVKVTDAQISANVLTADGEHFRITVTYDDNAKIPDGSVLVAEEIPNNLINMSSICRKQQKNGKKMTRKAI